MKSAASQVRIHVSWLSPSILFECIESPDVRAVGSLRSSCYEYEVWRRQQGLLNFNYAAPGSRFHDICANYNESWALTLQNLCGWKLWTKEFNLLLYSELFWGDSLSFVWTILSHGNFTRIWIFKTMVSEFSIFSPTLIVPGLFLIVWSNIQESDRTVSWYSLNSVYFYAIFNNQTYWTKFQVERSLTRGVRYSLNGEIDGLYNK